MAKPRNVYGTYAEYDASKFADDIYHCTDYPFVCSRGVWRAGYLSGAVTSSGDTHKIVLSPPGGQSIGALSIDISSVIPTTAQKAQWNTAYTTASSLQKTALTTLGVSDNYLTYTQNGSTKKLQVPLKEAYIEWGGKDLTGNFSPFDAAIEGRLGANRLAFMPPSAISVEYSHDYGETWNDYGATDDQLYYLTSNSNSTLYLRGPEKAATEVSKDNADQLRVTFDMTSGNVYTKLEKLILYVSTAGSIDCQCKIERTRIDAPDDFKEMKTVVVSGWSGYNVINGMGDMFYGGYSSYHCRYLRLTFWHDKITDDNLKYGGFRLYTVFAYGGVGWTTPSYMAQNGHLYTWYGNQIAEFPNLIRSKGFVHTSYNSDNYLLLGSGNAISKSSLLGSYLPLSGGTMSGTLTSRTIQPSAANTYNLGTASLPFARVYGTNFIGTTAVLENVRFAKSLRLTEGDYASSNVAGITITKSGITKDGGTAADTESVVWASDLTSALSSYTTKADLSTALASYVTQSAMDSKLSGYVPLKGLVSLSGALGTNTLQPVTDNGYYLGRSELRYARTYTTNLIGTTADIQQIVSKNGLQIRQGTFDAAAQGYLTITPTAITKTDNTATEDGGTTTDSVVWSSELSSYAKTSALSSYVTQTSLASTLANYLNVNGGSVVGDLNIMGILSAGDESKFNGGIQVNDVATFTMGMDVSGSLATFANGLKVTGGLTADTLETNDFRSANGTAHFYGEVEFDGYTNSDIGITPSDSSHDYGLVLTDNDTGQMYRITAKNFFNFIEDLGNILGNDFHSYFT